jgi:EmrB/QacA subfamily drug resistance transporter
MTSPIVTTADAERGHPRRRAVRYVLSGAALVVMAMVVVVNLAIPQMSAADLHPSSTQLLWIVDGYSITFGCLLIPAGALSDRYGRKGGLLAGLVLFTVGCAACALAPSVVVLLAARALTGIGAALVLPTTMSIIVNVHPTAERPQAITGWTVVLSSSGVVGTVAGGFLVQYGGWRAMFAVFAAIGAFTAFAVGRGVPRTPSHKAQLDPLGSGLLVLGFVGLLYSIIEGPELGWGSATVLAGFTVAVITLTVFVGHEMRTANPVLDPRLFRLTRLRAGTLGVTVVYFGMFSLLYVNAQYFQYARGLAPLTAGIATIPLVLGVLVTTRLSLRVADRIGVRGTVALGLTCLCLGFGLLSLVGPHTPYPLIVVFLLVISVGGGLSAAHLGVAIMSSVPRERAGVGSGLNSLTREIGSALGVAVLGAILNWGFFSQLPAELRGRAHSVVDVLSSTAGQAGHDQAVEAFTHAMDIAYRITALSLLVLAGFVVAWLRESRD